MTRETIRRLTLKLLTQVDSPTREILRDALAEAPDLLHEELTLANRITID